MHSIEYFIGIIFALGALVGWGLGDFAIQRSIRAIGPFKALFYITAGGGIALFPFIWPELPSLFSHPPLLFWISSAAVISFLAAVLHFEAFKIGKLSIIEPILGLELPLTVLLAVLLHGEPFSLIQGILTGVIFVGVLITITQHRLQLHYHKRLFEKGVIFSVGAACCLALVNLTFGISSQQTSPLLTLWYTHSFIALDCLIYFAIRPQSGKGLLKSLRIHPGIILTTIIIDNLAWISYGYATTYIAISLAITISESYIVLAVLLGLFINHDRIRRHQIIGAICTSTAVILLASMRP